MYGTDGPWLWSLSGTKKVRDKYQASKVSTPDGPFPRPYTADSTARLGSSNLSMAFRMRTAGAHSSCDSGETPPFYDALGLSTRPDRPGEPWWMQKATGRECHPVDILRVPEMESPTMMQAPSKHKHPAAMSSMYATPADAHRTRNSHKYQRPCVRSDWLAQTSRRHHKQKVLGPPLIYAPRLLV